MQTLCLASLGSGGLVGCGDGIYAPGPALTRDADAGGDPFQTEVLPTDAAADLLPPDRDEKVVENTEQTLKAAAATLKFQANSFSVANPATMTLEAYDWADKKVNARRGAIGPVYKITFDKLPLPSNWPIFTIDTVQQGQHPASSLLPSDVSPSALTGALTLARLQRDSAGNPVQWLLLESDHDLIDGQTIKLNLAPNGGSAPGHIIVGLVLECESEGDAWCERSDAFGKSCRAFCTSRDYTCGMGELCQ